MTDIQDTINWGIGTGITIGVAGMAMKGMNRLAGIGPRRRVRRKKKR